MSLHFPWLYIEAAHNPHFEKRSLKSSLHHTQTELNHFSKSHFSLHVFACLVALLHLSETEGNVFSRSFKARVQTERKQSGRRLRKETNKVVFEQKIRPKHGFGS